MWSSYCEPWLGGGWGWNWGWVLLMPLIWIGILGGAVFLIVRALRSGGPADATQDRCGACRAKVEAVFIRCPECGYRLKHNCPTCGHIIKTSWFLCPYCEAELTSDPAAARPAENVVSAATT